MKDIAAHLLCCHATTLLLFLQPTAAWVGKQRGPDRSEPRWLDLLADWVALLLKPHLQAKYFHLLALVLVFYRRYLVIKQIRLLRNKKPARVTIAGLPNTARTLVQEEINTATAKQEILTTELVELVWIRDHWLKCECVMEAAATQLKSEPIGSIQRAYLVWLDIYGTCLGPRRHRYFRSNPPVWWGRAGVYHTVKQTPLLNTKQSICSIVLYCSICLCTDAYLPPK